MEKLPLGSWDTNLYELREGLNSWAGLGLSEIQVAVGAVQVSKGENKQHNLEWERGFQVID